jgi:hypothetical protein
MKLSSRPPGSLVQDGNGQTFIVLGMRSGNKVAVRRLWTSERYTAKSLNVLSNLLWLPGSVKL